MWKWFRIIGVILVLFMLYVLASSPKHEETPVRPANSPVFKIQ